MSTAWLFRDRGWKATIFSISGTGAFRKSGRHHWDLFFHRFPVDSVPIVMCEHSVLYRHAGTTLHLLDVL